jgi:CheY-like chemotaxis protein
VSQRPTIVIVDDSREVREVLELALVDEGYKVIACSDAERAFELVRIERPDAVISDLMLGATSGLDLITRMRSDLAPPVPPVIACSGFPRGAELAAERGATAFVPKPFELQTILDALTDVLHDRRVPDHVARHAEVRARELRAAAAAAARDAMARIAPRYNDLLWRGHLTADWFSGYVGFGILMAAVLRGETLEVLLCTDPNELRRTEPLEKRLPLVRDIVETSSAILVPDVGARGALGAVAGLERGFFAGVPLRADKVTVGALCWLDAQARGLDSEDFIVLQELGRRTSDVLAGTDLVAPFWEPSGMMSREGFELVMSCALHRAQRMRLPLELLAFVAATPDAYEWSRALTAYVGAERLVLAELGGDRFALAVSRPNAREAVDAATRFLGERAALRGGGAVSVDGAAAVTLGRHEAVRMAEAALVRALRRGHGRVERLALRVEAVADNNILPG